MKSIIFMFLISVFCHGVALSQDIETILEGINKNESSIRSGKGTYTYEYSLVDTTNMSYSEINKRKRLELSKVTVNSINEKSYMLFQGKKQYYEVNSISIVGGTEKNFENVHIYYDGQNTYVQIFLSTARNGLMSPKAYIKNGKDLSYKKSVMNYLFDGKMYDNKMIYNKVKNDYKELRYKKTNNIQNVNCDVFSGLISSGGGVEIWFSEKYNFMPLHIEEDYLQKYGTKIIRDIEYKDHNGVYIPKKIVKMHFIKDKNGLNNNYNEVITVDNIEINSPINDSLFKIPFEKGIDVYDYRSNMKNKQK